MMHDELLEDYIFCHTINTQPNGTTEIKIQSLRVLKNNKNEVSFIPIDKEDPHGEKNILLVLNKEIINREIKAGKIIKEVGNSLLEMINDYEEQIKLDTSNIEENKKKLEELTIGIKNKLIRNIEAIRYVIAINNLTPKNEIDRMPAEFTKNISDNEFAVHSVLMDRMRYLKELLNNAQLVRDIKSGEFKVTSQLSETSDEIGIIGLEYILPLKLNETPKEAYDNFIKSMTGVGLRTLLLYWNYATEKSQFSGEANISEIMMKDERRKSTFSVSERSDFWQASKMLAATKLTLNIKHNNEWMEIKHPMLDIPVTISSKKNQVSEDGYPDRVHFRVLNPHNFKDKAYLATGISKGTLILSPETVYFATTIQNRARQRSMHKTSTFDEQYTIYLSHLEQTYKTNPRQARKKVKDKLKQIEEAGGISGYKEDKKARRFIIKHKVK